MLRPYKMILGSGSGKVEGRFDFLSRHEVVDAQAPTSLRVVVSHRDALHVRGGAHQDISRIELVGDPRRVHQFDSHNADSPFGKCAFIRRFKCERPSGARLGGNFHAQFRQRLGRAREDKRQPGV